MRYLDDMSHRQRRTRCELHGVALQACLVCAKWRGQCEYGDCTRRATETVTAAFPPVERRAVCPYHVESSPAR